MTADEYYRTVQNSAIHAIRKSPEANRAMENLAVYDFLLRPEQVEPMYRAAKGDPNSKNSRAFINSILQDESLDTQESVNQSLELGNQQPLDNIASKRANEFYARSQRTIFQFLQDRNASENTLRMTRGLPTDSDHRRFTPLFKAISTKNFSNIDKRLTRLEKDGISDEERNYIVDLIRENRIVPGVSDVPDVPAAPEGTGTEDIYRQTPPYSGTLMDRRFTGGGQPGSSTTMTASDQLDIIDAPQNETSRQMHRRWNKESMAFTAEEIRRSREMTRKFTELSIQQHKGLITSDQYAQERQRLKDEHSAWAEANRPQRIR